MGSLSYLFDFNQDSSATRKVKPQQRKHVDGLEAPRNSLELQGEVFQTSYNSNTYVGPFSAYEWLENTSFPTDTSTRKSISNVETTIKRPTNNNNNNNNNANARRTTPSVVARLMGMEMLPSSDNNYLPLPPLPVNKPPPERKEVQQSITNFRIKREEEEDSLHVNCNPLDFGKSKKASHRPEHPQEEELQKFKKDFEAWQAARFKECTKLVESSSGRNSEQLIAQENLNREKIALYSGSRTRNSISHEEDQMPNKPTSSPLGSYYSSRTRSRTVSYDSTDFETSSSDHRLGKSSAPTKIVILRPGPEQFVDSEESWVGCSSATSEERVGASNNNNNNNNSIEDFLKEVKERLKCELQGKYQKRVRGRGIETPFSEKQQPVDPKQIAQNIAKQVRESVMIRSDSPDFIINRDTRKIVADKLRNVLDNSIEPSSSPRNLTRSMSAPVSTNSFGKLLLEDRHVLTGAHIRRKHESSSSVDSNVLKRKKEKFTNIKERVSSFKYRFTLHGWLFRRRFHSSEDVFKYDYGSSRNDIMGGPTVVNGNNYGNVHENSTEVPPSPASVCSGSHEEWGRAADYLTPSSPFSELSPLRDSSLPQVFRDINCNLSELRRQLNALDTNGSAMEGEEEELTEEADTMELEDPAEAYVRDLLIASGLYDCAFNKQPLSRWESLSKPINNRVFEEVKMYGEDDSRTNRRLLFDLTNEALPAILGQPAMKFPPSGSKLLNSVLEMIRGYLSPPPDKFYFSIDGMVGRDLGCAPWTILVKDEVDAMGKEVESMITSSLIEEIVKDLHLIQLHRLRRLRQNQKVISSTSSVSSFSSSSSS